VEEPVKPETARGARKLLPRRKRTRRPEGARTPGSAGADADGAAERQDPEQADFDPVEFAEFLEGEESALEIDPGFRERLREHLWEMIRDGVEDPPTDRPPRRSS
jgi:hypothetical protein